jgi:hypothetical protein
MSASALATTQPTDICMTSEDMMGNHESIIDSVMSELEKNNRILMRALYEVYSVPDVMAVDPELSLRVKLAEYHVQAALKKLAPDAIENEVFENVKIVKSESAKTA